MEPLFRFLLARPPVVQRAEAPSIELAQNTAFQQTLARAAQSQKPRDALKAAARQFLADPSFVGEPDALILKAELGAFRGLLDQLETQNKAPNADVSNAIQDAFGRTPTQLVARKTLDGPIASLRDSIVAIKLLPEEHSRDIEALTTQLRDLEVVLRTQGDKDFPADGATLRRFRRRSLKLPPDAAPPPALNASELRKQLEERRRQSDAEKQRTTNDLLSRYRQLQAGVEELVALDTSNLETTVQRPIAGYMLPANVRPAQLLIEEVARRQRLSNLLAIRTETGLASGESAERSWQGTRSEPSVASEGPRLRLHSGTPSFVPVPPEESGFRLRPSAEARLSSETQQLLKERSLAVASRPLDQLVEGLRSEMATLAAELDSLLGRPVSRTFKRYGSTMVVVASPLPSVWNEIAVGGLTVSPEPISVDARVPMTHGKVAPAGVADLLVVKQHLLRYEGAEVGHIENILKGEKKEREHSRRRETEELLYRETELTTAEERELESTTRFEMTRETNETIREDASLKAGLTVSGKYGPTVEFSATAEGAVSRSKEAATATASKYSQEVTDRSATKVTERVLERSSLRVTNEVIERNLHTLDNTKGTGHISGVYQWVTKVYQAQMFNYGLRTLYEFMVPEPGAFLVAAMQAKHASAVEITKPMPFALRPDQITESNYPTWVHAYGATDVEPPPEMYRTKSWEFKAGDGDDSTDYVHSGQVAIDDGYRAIYGTVASLKNIWENDAAVDVALGSRTHRFAVGDWLWSTVLADERDSVPFAVKTNNVSDVAIAAEVKCQRTDRALLKWKHETHGKLTTAYRARLSEYEGKLAELEVQAGVEISGTNPESNLQLMRDELKKNCVSVLTEQQFDLFDAIAQGPFGLPEIDLYENEAEGPYVRFFEQAFEWEQMTWITYPYFWGTKSRWPERLAYADSDPVFNQFLQAGYCRASVPVRPGFEGAVDHFVTYGEAWNGGPLPTISSPLFLPIADEIAERLNRPGAEIPEGDPWLVRIPTSLVTLRADDKLPSWKQDATGEWVEG